MQNAGSCPDGRFGITLNTGLVCAAASVGTNGLCTDVNGQCCCTGTISCVIMLSLFLIHTRQAHTAFQPLKIACEGASSPLLHAIACSTCMRQSSGCRHWNTTRISAKPCRSVHQTLLSLNSSSSSMYLALGLLPVLTLGYILCPGPRSILFFLGPSSYCQRSETVGTIVACITLCNHVRRMYLENALY